MSVACFACIYIESIQITQSNTNNIEKVNAEFKGKARIQLVYSNINIIRTMIKNKNNFITNKEYTI